MVRIATADDAEQLNILNIEFNGEGENDIENIRASLDNNRQEIVVVADEDGTLAGYLDTIGIPYVGSNTLASAMGQDKVIIKEVNGYKIGFVFAELYRSELGNYLAELYYDQVDFIGIINMNRHISFRGKKENIPTNKFSEIYGGGGHPLASAMSFPEDLKEKILKYIYDEHR